MAAEAARQYEAELRSFATAPYELGLDESEINHDACDRVIDMADACELLVAALEARR